MAVTYTMVAVNILGIYTVTLPYNKIYYTTLHII